MLKIGLTGGIGSGKTVVAQIFTQLGVPVYEADAEARILTENNPEIKSALKKKFGTEFFLKDDSLDRSKLAAVVFSDREKLAHLNSIIHPFVLQHFNEWLNQHKESKYIIKAAAILFESGTNEGLDSVIVVIAPEEIRIKRVMERDRTTREEVQKRMRNQWSEDKLIERSDYIITNDDQTLVLPQVIKLHEMLSSEGEKTK